MVAVVLVKAGRHPDLCTNCSCQVLLFSQLIVPASFSRSLNSWFLSRSLSSWFLSRSLISWFLSRSLSSWFLSRSLSSWFFSRSLVPSALGSSLLLSFSQLMVPLSFCQLMVPATSSNPTACPYLWRRLCSRRAAWRWAPCPVAVAALPWGRAAGPLPGCSPSCSRHRATFCSRTQTWQDKGWC